MVPMTRPVLGSVDGWAVARGDFLRAAMALFPATLLWGASFPFAMAAVKSRFSSPLFAVRLHALPHFTAKILQRLRIADVLGEVIVQLGQFLLFDAQHLDGIGIFLAGEVLVGEVVRVSHVEGAVRRIGIRLGGADRRVPGRSGDHPDLPRDDGRTPVSPVPALERGT